MHLPWVRLFAIGYAAAALAGLLLGLYLWSSGWGLMVGVLTAWIGGAVVSLVLAYGWVEGWWLQNFVRPAAAVDQIPVADSERDRTEDWKWTADLMAEQFEADLADDRDSQAGQADDEILPKIRQRGA